MVKQDHLNQNRFCGPGCSYAGLKFRDERDRVESVTDQSHTENTAGTEYLTALQIEFLCARVCVHACMCVCREHTVQSVCVFVI